MDQSKFEMSIESAIIIATKAHRGQVDKGGHPYILHPLRVMLGLAPPTLIRLGPYQQTDLMLAAVLHDVVEDSDWSLEDLLRARLSLPALEAVDHLTRRKAEEESYSAYIERLILNPMARIVKAGDLSDNLSLTRLTPGGIKNNVSLLEREYRALLKVMTA